MYRKYKENKDNEYEKIIQRQVNESKLVAEREGISIPKTLEDYVAPSRAATAENNNKKTIYSLLSQEDEIEMDVS
jgi:ubiquitin-conjugating enzyme E2 R